MKIIGVSGGCDSMYLLSQLFSNEKIIVAHVNYGVRKEAIQETRLVQDYCEKNNIVCEVLYAPKYEKGNFQSWARAIRFNFFKQLCEKYQTKTIVLAHHQDDVLETYLLQKKRGSTPSYYGIQSVVEIDGYVIERPLLSLPKKTIVNMCHSNGIPYLEDRSNYSLKYQRNIVRKQLLNISDEEKTELLSEIHQLNNDKTDTFATIRALLFQHKIYHTSNKTMKNIQLFLEKGKGKFQLSNQLWLYPDGSIVSDECYAYTFSSIHYFKTAYFELSDKGTVGGFYVSENDFPITIRNYFPGDKIILPFGTKKLSRFFIDKKIPLSKRNTWPVVVNSSGEIIFVPKLGSKNKCLDANYNAYVLKYK